MRHAFAGRPQARGVDRPGARRNHADMDNTKPSTDAAGPQHPLVQDYLAQELLHNMRELHAQLEYLQLLMRLQFPPR